MRGLPIVLVAACSAQPTELAVTAPPGTTSIEVMLARDCFDSMGLPCGPGIAWPGAAVQVPGTVFELDRDERTLYPYTGRELRIRTKPGTGNVDRLVLVAFDPMDNMRGLVRIDDPPLTAPDQVIHVDIPPVDEIMTTPGPADPPNAVDGAVFRAHVWRPRIDPSTATCASTQTWDDSRQRWLREFYVPPSDHDCDQQEPLDCNPDWYDYQPLTGTPPTSCTTSSNQFPRACVVGAVLCSDGHATMDCAAPPEVTCVPDEMCDECPHLAPGCGAAMIEEQLVRDSNRLTFASCDFTYDDNDGNQPCNSNNGDTLELKLPVNCSLVSLYKNDWPASMQLAFSTLAIDTAMIQVSFKAMQPCTLELKFSGTAPTMLPTQRYILAIHNGVAVLELPFSIRFSASCGGGSRSCDVEGTSDGLWTCATQ